MRLRITLPFAIAAMGFFVYSPSIASALVFCMAFAGVAGGEILDASQVEAEKKSLESVRLLAEQTATEVTDLRNRVSSLAVGQATRPLRKF